LLLQDVINKPAATAKTVKIAVFFMIKIN